VSAARRESVLPPDLFNRLVKDSFRLDPKNNIRKVPVVRVGLTTGHFPREARREVTNALGFAALSANLRVARRSP